MSLKRSVPGRSRPYDLLLFEWQKTSKAALQRAEQARLAQAQAQAQAGSANAAAAAPAGSAAGGLAGAPAPASSGDGSAAGAAEGTGAAAPLARDPSTGSTAGLDPTQKPKKRKSGHNPSAVDLSTQSASAAAAAQTAAAAASNFPKSASERKAKKGIVYVGEWEESDDDAADELVDSDDEVEAALRGLNRIERGRPLLLQRGGGAGFAAASLWTGRNTKLNRLRETLRDVFRPRA